MASKITPIVLAAAMTTAAFGWLAPSAWAQQVYRIVGSDGKVSFSDQPPPANSTAKVASTATSPVASSGAAGGALPYELRQVANKYPVTLYTGDNCGPCTSARSMLTSRGIPFTEKTVSTQEDVKALQRLSGDTSLPFASIGGQQLNGFSDTEWTQFLNAAGYPATSVLPPSYRLVAATPLVVAAAAAAPSPAAVSSASVRPAAPTRSPAPAAAPPAASGDNPAGIKF